MNPSGLVQPVLTGLDLPTSATVARPERAPRLATVTAPAQTDADKTVRGPRHRYWSIRDLSRRLWLGRGYDLLRELIRTGILPAARSTHTWWVASADVQGLLDAFDAPAGKVRAFRGLDAWLRERCWVAPLTPEVEDILRQTQAGLAWRGLAYLPKDAWQADLAADGTVNYRHHSGALLPAPISLS
jgi:hypothetical protein